MVLMDHLAKNADNTSGAFLKYIASWYAKHPLLTERLSTCRHAYSAFSQLSTAHVFVTLWDSVAATFLSRRAISYHPLSSPLHEEEEHCRSKTCLVRKGCTKRMSKKNIDKNNTISRGTANARLTPSLAATLSFNLLTWT